MTDDEIEACFAAGRDAPVTAACPYDPATSAAHWWTRGFACTVRLLRAIDAERDAKRYRRLGALVEFGDWGVCRGEVVDSFGRTEETHMDDKTDMDAWLDKPEVIAEAEACAIALAKRHSIPAPEPMSARRSASLDELEAVVIAYCKECAAQARAQALKDAAQECDALASIEGIAQRCAEAVRALAQKGDA